MTRNAMATLLTAATMMLGATPAIAQSKYYMRERIVGMSKTPTYTPVYSSTLGACTNGNQSKPITGCTASDGSPATIANCSGSPQFTEQVACTTTTKCALNATSYRVSGKTPDYVGQVLNTSFLQDSPFLTIECQNRGMTVCYTNRYTGAGGPQSYNVTGWKTNTGLTSTYTASTTDSVFVCK